MSNQIPEWIIRYDQANYQSGAGKAVRELMLIVKAQDEIIEAHTQILDKIKHGLQQMFDEAPNMLSPDGRFGERAEDRNHGMQQGAKLALTMVKLIEERELEKTKSQS